MRLVPSFLSCFDSLFVTLVMLLLSQRQLSPLSSHLLSPKSGAVPRRPYLRAPRGFLSCSPSLRAETPSLHSRFISKEILTIREAVWLTDNTYKYEDLVRMMGEIISALEGKIRVSRGLVLPLNKIVFPLEVTGAGEGSCGHQLRREHLEARLWCVIMCSEILSLG